jgi:hypothetical protein
MISAPAVVAPRRDDAFLILDGQMVVGALSKRAQSLLGVSEHWALDRRIDEFLTPAHPRVPGTDTLETALARAAQGELTPRTLEVNLRSSKSNKVSFVARIGPCGPPPSTLIVFDAN